MTHPLLEFLNRCLDADEELARAASANRLGTWLAETGPPEGHPYEVYELGLPLGSPHECTEHRGLRPNMCDDNAIISVDGDFVRDDAAVAQHVAAHDPAAVLAAVAAHRAILAEHAVSDVQYDDTCRTCVTNAADAVEDLWKLAAYPCQTVRLVASAYAHREGYDQDWGPT